MFVTASDFDRLPFNLTGLDQLTAGVFDDFVSYNEEEKLRKLLGNKFYDAFVAGLALLPATYDVSATYNLNDLVVSGADIYKSLQAANLAHQVTDTAWWVKQTANRWLRLREGDTYSYYNRPQKWYGMNRLVVPLIYSLYTKFTYDNQTGAGVVTAKNENSDTVSAANRIVRGWNKYADLAAGDWPSVIDWTFVNWPDLENSLFGYLFLTDTVWDDLFTDGDGFGSMRAYLAYSFQFPGKTNVFGI